MAGARVPKYDWTAILTPVHQHRQKVVLVQGEDFEVEPHHFRQQARAAARRAGIEVQTRCLVDRVILLPVPARRYDWDVLFDGNMRSWHLDSFPKGVEGFRVTISRKAKELDVTYRTKTMHSQIWLQALTKGGEEILPAGDRPKVFQFERRHAERRR